LARLLFLSATVEFLEPAEDPFQQPRLALLTGSGRLLPSGLLALSRLLLPRGLVLTVATAAQQFAEPLLQQPAPRRCRQGSNERVARERLGKRAADRDRLPPQFPRHLLATQPHVEVEPPFRQV